MKSLLIFAVTALLFFGFTQSEKLPEIKMQVAQTDQIGPKEEEEEWNQGCSIYCMLDIDSVLTSGNLKSQGNLKYDGASATDFNLRTAWAEGKPGSGKGEWIEYWMNRTDMDDDLTITEVIIFNGYRKSLQLWEENARVKTLKMYINGKPAAVLNLADTFKMQSATVKPIKLGKRSTKIRFEILDIYPGKKFDDVAISELEFEGEGHH